MRTSLSTTKRWEKKIFASVRVLLKLEQPNAWKKTPGGAQLSCGFGGCGGGGRRRRSSLSWSLSSSWPLLWPLLWLRPNSINISCLVQYVY